MLNKFPRYLSIQTSSLCNASCVFCPYRDIKNLFPEKIMDMDLYKSIIDECGNYKGIERIILYMNNEPLTDPYLIERINYAKGKVPWSSVQITTNGLLLTEEISEQIINSGLDCVGISFHGMRKETIEKTMGIPFELALERISKFIDKVKRKKNIKDYIVATFLKHRYLSVEEREETFAFWKSKGVERISYFDCPVSRAGNVKSLPRVYHEGKLGGCGSIWANEMVHIVETGEIVLCCMDWKREIILGEIKKNSIYNIWHSDKYALIRDKRDGRQDSEDSFICRRCEAAVEVDKKEAKINKNIFVGGEDKVKDILLVLCPAWGINMPPLGLAYLSRYLRFYNFDPAVLDLNIEIFNSCSVQHRDFWNLSNLFCWLDEKFFYEILRPIFNEEIVFWAEKITVLPVLVLGFSVTRANLRFTIELVKEIKRIDLNKLIIFGGPACNIEGERRFVPEGLVDFFVLGEGEETLVDILNLVKKGGAARKYIPGCIMGHNDNSVGFIPRAPVRSLDSIPFPDFKGFDLNKYQKKMFPLLGSRSCLNRCEFCNDWFVWPKYRERSAENIFEEINYHLTTYNIVEFEFFDLAMNNWIIGLAKLCDLILDKGIKISWFGNFVIRQDDYLRLFEKMKKAGCIALQFGIESGSDNILKSMNKGFSIAEAERVIKQSAMVGINNFINILVGFPGETKDDHAATLEFIERNRESIHSFGSVSLCYLTPQSKLEKNYQKYNIGLPEKNFSLYWYDNKNNNYEERQKRALDVKNLAKKLNMPFEDESAVCYDQKLEEKKERYADLLSEKTDFSKVKQEILLVICPMWDVFLPPMGVAYLASYLENKGVKADILDINIETYVLSDAKRKELWKMENYNLWAWEDLFEETKKYFEEDIDRYVQEIIGKGYKIVGFSLYGVNVLFSIEVAVKLKKIKPDLFVIFGGPSCSFLHSHPQMPVRGMVSFKTQKSLVAPGVVDAFVIGEGEEVLFNLVTAYCSAKIHPDKGVILYLNGRYSPFVPYLQIERLEEIPYPAWDKLHLDSYQLKNTLPILLSRGCMSKCTFCNDWRIWEGRYRVRPAEDIFQEITAAVKKFNIHGFQCNDLLFNGSLKMLRELTILIISSGVNIHWSAQGVIRKDMDLAFLKQLRKSGLNWITYGVESLSDKVLKKMKKTFTFDAVRDVLKDTKTAGIGVAVNFITGFPNETEEEFNITKNRLAEVRSDIDEISSLNPCYITCEIDLEKYYQDFSITLSHEKWFYHWQSQEGRNTYAVRKRRAKELAEFARTLGIKVCFTGIYDEGEAADKDVKNECGNDEVQDKQDFFLPSRKRKRQRGVFKWILLILVSMYTFFYIVYFWGYMVLRNKVLLGGRKK